MRAALAATFMTLAGAAPASDFSLSLPVDCTLGETCYIQQYVDHDPGPRAQDFQCRALTYDGHKGTDFALPTLADMARGVDVLAAAAGVVRGSRDGMSDKLFTRASGDAIAGRECGNGLVLVHPDGWETQYCHLKRGSLRVRTGDRVVRGQVLGQIGLSGRTQFPHLHLSVRKDGGVADPFDLAPRRACDIARTPDTLWAAPVDYTPGGLVEVGLTGTVPSFEAIKAGTATDPALPASAGALVVFGYGYGSVTGDVMELSITGPQGDIVRQRVTLDRTQAQYFRAAGKRLRADRWPAGSYTGRVTLSRAGTVYDQRETRITFR